MNTKIIKNETLLHLNLGDFFYIYILSFIYFLFLLLFLFFIFNPLSVSLPTFDEKTTKLHLHAEKLTENVLHLNLGHFVGCFFCVCSFVLFYVSPLIRQLQRHHFQDWRLRWTPKLLRLKLQCI
jgi:uncharacterized BrkB/YihY/UPF0761 family membrane protein